MTPLQFLLTTKGEIDQSNAVEFRPDSEKKSAFWVEGCRSASPAHGYIIASPGAFLLGGLQIISNSRTVEIYLNQNNNLQETYLTTCRGVPFQGNYKIVCVIPGGPRPIQQAHLKFVTNEPELIITSLRVTARIPESCAEPANRLPDRNPLPSSPSLPATPSTDHTSDWNTSIAGLAFLVRNTSEKHLQQIQSLHQQQQQAMEVCLWQPLVAQIASQASLLSQQNEQIQQQTHLLQQQQEQIQALTSQVQELTNLVQRVIDTSSSASSSSSPDQESERHTLQNARDVENK
ncbi:hypothetical protein FisN_16Lh100 [Fistulifera solaris]|uniref:Uncharacterized protein n=1 Tax=Fistulifera solaris TaxID=1519565 RepID=A0A1Z5KJ20_FISSO|nr:hypothetical protein FisN_16Lh100 [Fistulifera solaris]|eukprot:GAX26269.1 hypothetical protein FisN_16Lh100 [Fistulifera solaris]